LTNIEFSLRLKPADIRTTAERYEYQNDDAPLAALAPRIRTNRFLSLNDLRAVVQWKAPRAAHHVDANSEAVVVEVTGFALRAKQEESRIQSLQILTGVNWPTASVILHFFHEDDYPILDFRALWSLGVDAVPRYSFPLWHEYTTYMRNLASTMNVDMRLLDRALWQFSKERQPPSTAN
jgi:hypothetical protein